MKNKQEIEAVFASWVVHLLEVAKSGVNAFETFKEIPDKPTKEELVKINGLLRDMLYQITNKYL